MSFKRILALFTALIMLALLCACETQTNESSISEDTAVEESVNYELPDPDKESTVTPLFWKASDEKGNVIWLLGSIHAGTDDYYPLPEKMLTAFDGADELAVEVDVVALEKDLQLATQALLKVAYTDGTRISDHIDKELYDRAVAYLTKNNMYNAMYDVYKPTMWMSLVTNVVMVETGLDSSIGIDSYFLKYAKNNAKKIVEIESAVAQYTMLGGFSDELQEMLLAEALSGAESGEEAKALKELAKLWGEGDFEKLQETLSSTEEVEESEKAIYDEYYNAMYKTRNDLMTKFCTEALKEGRESFVIVGLAHFLGDDGIIKQLEALGYTVELIEY